MLLYLQVKLAFPHLLLAVVDILELDHTDAALSSSEDDSPSPPPLVEDTTFELDEAKVPEVQVIISEIDKTKVPPPPPLVEADTLNPNEAEISEVPVPNPKGTLVVDPVFSEGLVESMMKDSPDLRENQRRARQEVADSKKLYGLVDKIIQDVEEIASAKKDFAHLFLDVIATWTRVVDDREYEAIVGFEDTRVHECWSTKAEVRGLNTERYIAELEAELEPVERHSSPKKNYMADLAKRNHLVVQEAAASSGCSKNKDHDLVLPNTS
ncbi:hypothetical protein AMTR_s00018p00222470 [Amborella trichopoda]|uniref:Uncharacterized protein n=1 Tax=Amborella trichopoda TaxID=13333 RepID=W1PJQ8_AMBTC|nr:hypothetical protein AMTR_s00018p00222470 [Amborella trichopoda]